MYGTIRAAKSAFLLWMLMLFLVVGLLLSGSIVENRMISDYYTVMDEYASLDRMRSLTAQTNAAMEGYLFERDQEAEKRYTQAVGMLNELVFRLGQEVQMDDNSLFYFRTYQNMLTYLQEAISEYRGRGGAYAAFYDSQNGLKLQGEYLIAQAEKLTSTYHEYSRGQNTKSLESLRSAGNIRDITTILAFFLITLVVFKTGTTMIRDLKSVSESALLFSKGIWDTENTSKSAFYEINNVMLAMSNMKHSMLHQMEILKENADMEQRLIQEKLQSMQKDQIIQRTQLEALQMQINPHFLFNTLHMINCTALLENHSATVELVEAISNIMRYAMSKNTHSASLAAELDVLRSYLRIQTMRFQESIIFSLTVTPQMNLNEIFVPPMILQPFVENAIKHGMADVTQGGRVDIVVKRLEDGAQVEIDDNGCGMDQDTLLFITQGGERKGEGKGIGVGNVLARLSYYYGREGLAQIQSRPGKGTHITIHFPGERGGSDADRFGGG